MNDCHMAEFSGVSHSLVGASLCAKRGWWQGQEELETQGQRNRSALAAWGCASMCHCLEDPSPAIPARFGQSKRAHLRP